MTKQPKIPSGMIGHAGEHYVIYQLYRRGHLSALAPEGSPTSDVLVMTPNGQSAACALQVKTQTGGGKRRSWMLGKKNEDMVSDGLLYVFVDLNPTPPEVFIVPRAKGRRSDQARSSGLAGWGSDAWSLSQGQSDPQHRLA